MSRTEKLPEGIELLRRFKVNNGATVRPHRFEKLLDGLNKCAGSSKPRAMRCDHCPYLEECVQRFDAVCGRVAMARGAGRKSGQVVR